MKPEYVWECHDCLEPSMLVSNNPKCICGHLRCTSCIIQQCAANPQDCFERSSTPSHYCPGTDILERWLGGYPFLKASPPRISRSEDQRSFYANEESDDGNDTNVATMTPTWSQTNRVDDTPSPSAMSSDSPWDNAIYPLKPLRREIIQHLGISFRLHTSTAPKPAAQDSKTVERGPKLKKLSESNNSKGRPTKRRKHSALNGDDEKDSDNEDGSGDPTQPPAGSPMGNDRLLWACPFFKKDRIAYRGCYNATLRQFSRIK